MLFCLEYISNDFCIPFEALSAKDQASILLVFDRRVTISLNIRHRTADKHHLIFGTAQLIWQNKIGQQGYDEDLQYISHYNTIFCIK